MAAISQSKDPAGQLGLITKHIEKHIFFATDAQISIERTLITREKSVEICASVAISRQLLKTRLPCIHPNLLIR